MPTGAMLSVSLVPRLWSSPLRTMGDCSLLLRRFFFLIIKASTKREWLAMNRKGPWEGLLPTFLCAHIFIERETSGYEAGVTVCASHWALQLSTTTTTTTTQNFINKQINLQKYCPQLARLFKAGQCVQNIKIETKAINIIILSRGLIQLSG